MMCKHPCKCFLSLLCSGRVRNKTEIQAIRNICAGGNVAPCPCFSGKSVWKSVPKRACSWEQD